MAFPKLASPALLSPMSGVTDVAFRALCKRYGVGMTYTEFVSSAALVRANKETQRMLAVDPSERPVGVQLFGSDEDEVVAAARLVEGRFDVIDINCGCPAWKVVKTGAGSAMLNDPRKVASLVAKLAKAVRTPITVKIRAGIDERRINAVQVAQAAQAAGAAAIAVHGRTQQQGYSGMADWDVVRQVKRALRIPVIGNGDVFTAQDFVEKRRFSGADYIMVARGAIGNPFLFARISAALAGEDPAQDPGKAALFLEYLALARRYAIAFGQVKGHAIAFTKGLRGGVAVRERLTRAQSLGELEAVYAALGEVEDEAVAVPQRAAQPR